MKTHAALVELLHFLRDHDYRFTTVTPGTHQTILTRASERKATLRDIFGWNREFEPADINPELRSILERADVLETRSGGKLKSRIRVASLASDLFIHSAFPTGELDSVFFGPDTYRFCRFVGRHAGALSKAQAIVDMGAGSGAGGIAAARLAPDAEVILVDVNPEALRLAGVNAAAAGVTARLVLTDQVPDEWDVLIGNAPYMMDAASRSYRDGGELLGGAVSLDWILQGLSRLRAGGTILLYTGAAYVDGHSPLLDEVAKACRASGASLYADEIDPDVFGDELAEPAYAGVERIAAVGIRIELGR